MIILLAALCLVAKSLCTDVLSFWLIIFSEMLSLFLLVPGLESYVISPFL